MVGWIRYIDEPQKDDYPDAGIGYVPLDILYSAPAPASALL